MATGTFLTGCQFAGESGRGRPRAVERHNTDAPLYSAWVAEKLSMPEVYEQYGLYCSSLFGVSFLTNQLFRARALAKHAEAKIAHAPESQLLYWTHMANVELWRLECPRTLHCTFESRGHAGCCWCTSVLGTLDAVT